MTAAAENIPSNNRITLADKENTAVAFRIVFFLLIEKARVDEQILMLNRRRCRHSRSCRAAGWLKEHLRGSGGIGG